MKIIDINRNTLYNLYEQYPNSLNGIDLDGDYLIYQNEAVNISKFNINNLLNEKTSFAVALSTLSPQDIFKIIELHAVFLTKVGLPIKIASDNQKKNDDNKLLSADEFYRIINSSEELDIQQRKNLDTYYGYLENLILYEEFLLPELKIILKEFKDYLYELEYVYGENNQFNSNQEEMLRNSKEFELRKAQKQGLIEDTEKKKNVRKLELKKKKDSLDEAGIISALQVIVIIVIVVIILSVVTFKLVK